MGYRNVLVAVDMTEEAEEVIERARTVAAVDHAKLTLCTVVRPLTQVYGGLDMLAYSQASVSFEEEALNQAREQLQTLALRFGVAPDDVQVVLGPPAAQVVDTAASIGADLIVIGSHGRHGLGLLLGSTANGVLHRARCDVLTVRIGS